MSTVSTYYGIPGPVPFVDVEITSDNRLYIDPHAIRLTAAPQPFADEAIDCVDSFMREVTACVISGTPDDRERGEALLQHFVEPWETRLGMAASGFQGHGGASVVGSWIWDTLNSDVEALVRVGVLRQIEDLPLFVEGIDRDITSDVTTRLIFSALARFTAAMLTKYPEFSARGDVRDFTRQIWDPVGLEWTYAEIALPVAGGRPLLVVPKRWARETLLMSATRFYETSVLSFAQLEQAVVSSQGKVLKTPKDVLKTQAGLGRGRVTNLRVTQRAFESEQDLLAQFKNFVASKVDRDTTNESAA